MVNKTLKYLIELCNFMEYHNKMAPFPPYDTEYVIDIKNKIKEMEENVKVDYDDLPVAACSYCKSLDIRVDDLDNNHCMRCGTFNEITIYKNINEYLETKDDYN